MKGQMVFEFVVASLILFSIIIYTISFLSNDFNMRRNSFISDRLESNALRVSNILLGSQENGLIGEWPRLDPNKLIASCGDYRSMQKSLGLKEEEPYVKYMNFNVTVEDSSGVRRTCGRDPPESTGSGHVTRYALAPSDEIAKIDVTVW